MPVASRETSAAGAQLRRSAHSPTDVCPKFAWASAALTPGSVAVTLAKGRVIRGSASAAARNVKTDGIGEPRGRVVPRVLVDAARDAADRVNRADQKARAVIDDAERAALSIREKARAEGRDEGAAELAAAWVRLRNEQAARDARDLDRTVDLARAMAERLLGEALRLDPTTIVAVARQALASARQARRIAVKAHPADAEALRRDLGALGLEQVAIEIHADETRPRGSLLFETDLGFLDADLPLQLDRLARSLRNGLTQ
jgi:flagellar biosynthesis/type III secretory pathway protein FliH